VDTERGTDFYSQAVPSRPVHPEAFDFDALYTRSITEINAAVRALKPEDYSVVVIDSITHLWEAAMAAYSGRTTSVGSIPMHAWGKIKKPYKELTSWMLATPMHVIICGRQKSVYETDEETEELKVVGVTMRAEGETPYAPHILIRMEQQRGKKTNEIGNVIAYAEKDRTGVLSGRSFVNPTFDLLLRPILPLLGETQGSVASNEETAIRDAEALEQQDREFSSASGETLRKMSANIDLCEDVATLKKLAKTITPELKSKMTPSDVAKLREKYQSREAQLSGTATQETAE
jgi:hypothetical protein